jgi:antirestriction protein ArdC
MPLDPALQEAAAGRAKWRRAAGMRAISEHLIEQLKQGRAPWVKRWSAGERFIHTTR